MKNKPALTFFVVAGEESGDIHGAKLIQSLKKIYPNISFVGHGGDRMKNEGMEIIEHVDSLAMMGFTEVVKHLPYMLNVMGKTIQAIEQLKPDRIILIDYPGFNLRLAKRLRFFPVPITYFILPQVWAWKEKRIQILKKHVNQCLCIFPFEQKWFEDRGMFTHYPGHPFSEPFIPKENRTQFFSRHGLNETLPLVVLLPGSRQQEVDRHWNIFLATVDQIKKQIPESQFCVAKTTHVSLNPLPNYIKVESQKTQCAILYADCALASSGTATLECAVRDTPVIVCYKMSLFSWMILKRFVRVPFASMVNLIANKKIVPEFLQTAMNPNSLSEAILPLIKPTPERKKMIQDFETVRRSLGLPGVYDRSAKAIIKETMF